MNKLQAALYAWLLGVDDVYAVVSFIEGKEYDTPHSYSCNKNNTSIIHFQLSKEYPNFENTHIRPVISWWNKYIETGVSPEFDSYKDEKIISQIKLNEQEKKYE